VLNHTAGLHTLAGVAMEMLTPERRREMFAAVRRPPGWHVGRDAGYSEYLGWYVLGLLIEDATGAPVRDHLRTALLDPLGLADTFVGMLEAEYFARLECIGVNYDLRDYFKAFPMLVERTPTACCTVNCAFGGYTTARDLTFLYAALLARLDGNGHDCLPSGDTLTTFCSSARPPTYDVVLGRECEYGLGFMTALAGHQFGREPSPTAFGHSGNVGSSFAFADPVHDLAVAVVFNGITDPDSAFLRRPALVRAIYLDLGLEADVVSSVKRQGRLGRLLRRP
jgi:CubicO group peptidase (beta-lactamase class C family)